MGSAAAAAPAGGLRAAVRAVLLRRDLHLSHLHAVRRRRRIASTPSISAAPALGCLGILALLFVLTPMQALIALGAIGGVAAAAAAKPRGLLSRVLPVAAVRRGARRCARAAVRLGRAPPVPLQGAEPDARHRRHAGRRRALEPARPRHRCREHPHPLPPRARPEPRRRRTSRRSSSRFSPTATR